MRSSLEPRHAARRIRRFKRLCLAAPPITSLLAAMIGILITAAHLRSAPGVLEIVVFPLVSAIAGLAPSLTICLAYRRAACSSYFWPALLGSIACGWVTMSIGLAQAAPNAQAGFDLIAGPFSTGLLGVIASLAGVLVGLIPRLQFRLPLEPPFEDECRKCGYSLVGISSSVCPECGKQR